MTEPLIVHLCDSMTRGREDFCEASENGRQLWPMKSYNPPMVGVHRGIQVPVDMVHRLQVNGRELQVCEACLAALGEKKSEL